MLKRIHFDDRESWLEGRQMGIGGSEAAAIVGKSPWMTPLDLWKNKLGIVSAKDLSDNAAVQQGVKWEPILRDLFAATHPEYEIWYHPYDILCQEDRPWLFSTLDGELLNEDGKYGVLEIKTSTPNGKAGWEKWNNGRMPDNYYCQVLHELLATGYDYVRLFAALFTMDGSYTIKTYEIERDEVKEDLEWLLEQEQTFYTKNIKGGEMPSMILTL